MSRTTLPSKMTPQLAHELAADFVAKRRQWAGGLELTMTAPVPPAPAPAPPGAQPPAPAPTPPPPAERPEGVSEEEWNALGDPGRRAIVRERERATTAERALAAARTPAPPAPKPEPLKPGDVPKGPDGQPDIAAIVNQAVERAVQAATTPFLEAQAQREAEAAAVVIRDAVTTAAAAKFHDATDALAHIDLTTLTDGSGRPDQQKITTALDALLASKPHLGKVVDFRRQAVPGAPIGAGGATAAPLEDRVKASLARMQQATGVKFVDSPGT